MLREAIERSRRAARRINDENGLQNAYAIEMRLLLQEGRSSEACATEPPQLNDALPSMRGEVMASRALVLATIGRLEEARKLAAVAQRTTRAIETQALVRAVAAVCALKERRDDLGEACDALIQHVFTTGSVDLAVTAYRANPDLLPALMASPRIRDRVAYLLKTSRRREREPKGWASRRPPALIRQAHSHQGNARSMSLCARVSRMPRSPVSSSSHQAPSRRTSTTSSTSLGIRSRTALALNAAAGRYATSTATTRGSDGSG